ncbi:MAG: Cob(I)yrinic acid a,c-diamide adenosyltransferase [Alphaproteobacteria bacterium MarineAlpha6_Bin2]|mgnify:FL=1|nr:MAG: Cob(I)yrinic acid a,c-diamide adenosyltransferase [Alphaproteobacteria bacterium MarineAlpha6_Bin2]
MVKLNKIYTRKGDKGSTSLGDGKKVLKHSIRVEAYGTVDEANAFIGLVILKSSKQIKKILLKIQNDLFDLGADLCTPEKKNIKKLKITLNHIHFIETKIDFYNKSLSPLRSFVLPGGSESSIFFHLARTVVRRAERKVSDLLKKEKINPHIISYLNRLSDLLFVLARYTNNKGKKDILWIPGKNTGKS